MEPRISQLSNKQILNIYLSSKKNIVQQKLNNKCNLGGCVKKLQIRGIITTITFLLLYHNFLSQELGISLGAMRNFSPEASSNSTYSFYPEVSVSNNFFSQYLIWELALGYLNDGLDSDDIESKGVYYNSNDYILSTRFFINSSKVFDNKYLPELIAGFSLHFVNLEYVDPPGPIILHYFSDENETRLYFDMGAEYKITEV